MKSFINPGKWDPVWRNYYRDLKRQDFNRVFDVEEAEIIDDSLESLMLEHEKKLHKLIQAIPTATFKILTLGLPLKIFVSKDMPADWRGFLVQLDIPIIDHHWITEKYFILSWVTDDLRKPIDISVHSLIITN